MSEELSLEPLKSVFQALQSAIQDLNNPAIPHDYMRDAIIQRFEFTFELSWKTLKRYFKINNNIQEDSIKNLFREAGKQGLIQNVEAWFSYLEARNMTSHTYAKLVAEKVLVTAIAFQPDVDSLIRKLESILE